MLKKTKTTAKEKKNEDHYNSSFSDLWYVSLISIYQTLHDSEKNETRTVNLNFMSSNPEIFLSSLLTFFMHI